MNKCPACKTLFRKPLRPADAVGAAAYMNFCPHCHRELQYGPGVRIRLVLIAGIVVAYFAGFFDAGNQVLGIALRVAAGIALLAAWVWLPTFVAATRQYNPETGMTESDEENPGPENEQP